jgi:CRISPR-associated protein Cas1
MRRLLNTLFVLTEDSYLALDGENIVVLNGDDTLGRFPLHTPSRAYSTSVTRAQVRR